MGETLSELIKFKKINSLFSFIIPFLTSEKIALLKSINEDNLIDEEMFQSFFLCGKREFLLISDENELINFWELMVIIFLIKSDIYKTKLNNILNLFIFDETDPLLTKEIFIFMKEVFVHSIQKLYSIQEINREVESKIQKETKNYIVSLFKSNNTNEEKIFSVKIFLEEDDSLFNLISIINESVEEVLFHNNK